MAQAQADGTAPALRLVRPITLAGQALTRLQWALGSRHVTTEQGAEGSGGPQLRDWQELQAWRVMAAVVAVVTVAMMLVIFR